MIEGRSTTFDNTSVDGLLWRYVVGGRGERTILVPSGGTRVPDMYLLLFEALEPHFRVISPSYPAAHTAFLIAPYTSRPLSKTLTSSSPVRS